MSDFSQDQPLRVMLVDDQPLIRTGFATILDTEPNIVVVGEAADGAEAIRLAEELQPNVICMDVQMPVMDGIEATKHIVDGDSKAAVLILTTFDHDEFLFNALKAGASGFLLKTAGPEELIHAVRTLGAGEALLAPTVTRRVLERFSMGDDERSPKQEVVQDLTDREWEILQLVAQGLSNVEIAEQLFVGPATVKTHVSNVLMKLGVKDRLHAVIWAYENNVVGN